LDQGVAVVRQRLHSPRCSYSHDNSAARAVQIQMLQGKAVILYIYIHCVMISRLKYSSVIVLLIVNGFNVIHWLACIADNPWVADIIITSSPVSVCFLVSRVS